MSIPVAYVMHNLKNQESAIVCKTTVCTHSQTLKRLHSRSGFNLGLKFQLYELFLKKQRCYKLLSLKECIKPARRWFSTFIILSTQSDLYQTVVASIIFDVLSHQCLFQWSTNITWPPRMTNSFFQCLILWKRFAAIRNRISAIVRWHFTMHKIDCFVEWDRRNALSLDTCGYVILWKSDASVIYSDCWLQKCDCHISASVKDLLLTATQLVCSHPQLSWLLRSKDKRKLIGVLQDRFWCLSFFYNGTKIFERQELNSELFKRTLLSKSKCVPSAAKDASTSELLKECFYRNLVSGRIKEWLTSQKTARVTPYFDIGPTVTCHGWFTCRLPIETPVSRIRGGKEEGGEEGRWNTHFTGWRLSLRCLFEKCFAN